LYKNTRRFSEQGACVTLVRSGPSFDPGAPRGKKPEVRHGAIAGHDRRSYARPFYRSPPSVRFVGVFWEKKRHRRSGAFSCRRCL
jgi:hypothetical protein